MAAIDDLIDQISDVSLRKRIRNEVNRIQRNKKFGLVFENHLPECTPLYGLKIRVGSKVALKNKKPSDMCIVQRITGDKASCEHLASHKNKILNLSDLVCVAEFGDPIYPYLQKIDEISTAPESDLWHELIEADNYHALQLLDYLYTGKVDCIYIDPPYNTGARDWKYNNDYVDSSDSYRHSKWLSFIEKRLKLAKKLLNPTKSVLICTIDEKEYLHLGMLLNEIFPEANIQMISSVVNPAGSARKGLFSRSDEYIYIVTLGNETPNALPLNDEWLGGVKNTSKKTLHWNSLSRTGTSSHREDVPTMFFPIYVSKDGSKIIKVGESIPRDLDREKVDKIKDTVTIWPIHKDGSEGRWQQSPATLRKIIKKGYVRLGRFTPRGMAISYLKRGEQQKVENGIFPIIGKRKDGSILVDDKNYVPTFIPTTQWNISSHDASRYGSNLIRKLLPDRKFQYPKSLYAEKDIIKFFTSDNPNALIVDFFAGSGTTLHAVNLLNKEDGGHRKCILVTNNEVSDDESKKLIKQGYYPGDKEWEKLGIARYITWPRTVTSITGKNSKNEVIKGEYGTYHDEYIPDKNHRGEYRKIKIADDENLKGMKISDGFKSNVVYFKLRFLDKNSVALGKQFRELLPILWMKADGIGKCPTLKNEDTLPDYMILSQNKFAILLDEKYYREFLNKVYDNDEIKTVFIITNSDDAYHEMIANLEDKQTYQLYKDYLDNFRINTRG